MTITLGTLLLSLFITGSSAREVSPEAQQPDLRVSVSKTGMHSYHYKWTIQNSGQLDEFIADNAMRANGSIGPYFDTDKKGSLLISYVAQNRTSRLRLTKNDSAIHLVRLAPGSSFTGEIDLSFPVARTLPPFEGTPNPASFSEAEVKSLVVQIAVFKTSDALLAILERRRTAWVNGLEEAVGAQGGKKTLLELQEVATSLPIALPK